LYTKKYTNFWQLPDAMTTDGFTHTPRSLIRIGTFAQQWTMYKFRLSDWL